MEKYVVLDTEIGRLCMMTKRQLKSELKTREKQARKMLKEQRVDHVVYAIERTASSGSASFHLMPCTAYTHARFEKCFPAGGYISPYSVGRKVLNS